MSETEVQSAFSLLLAQSAAHIMNVFDFHAAVRQMRALNFGWVPHAVGELRTLHPHWDDAAIESWLVFRARDIARGLLRDAAREGTRHAGDQNWNGAYCGTGGFVVILRPNGIMHLFFSTVDADNYGVESIVELGNQYDAAVERARVNTPAQHTRAAIDLTPGRRRLLPQHR